MLEEHVSGMVVAIAEGYHVEGKVLGASARELNRKLLTVLREEERRTRPRRHGPLMG